MDAVTADGLRLQLLCQGAISGRIADDLAVEIRTGARQMTLRAYRRAFHQGIVAGFLPFLCDAWNDVHIGCDDAMFDPYSKFKVL